MAKFTEKLDKAGNIVPNHFEARIFAELVKVSAEIKTLENVAKTPYRDCMAKLETGKIVPCKMFEANFAYGVNVGESYLTTVDKFPKTNKDGSPVLEQDKDGKMVTVYSFSIRMSHLQSLAVTQDDLGFIENETVTSADSTLASQAL